MLHKGTEMTWQIIFLLSTLQLKGNSLKHCRSDKYNYRGHRRDWKVNLIPPPPKGVLTRFCLKLDCTVMLVQTLSFMFFV